MLYNGVGKLPYFRCKLEILCRKIPLIPYKNEVKMYKIIIYQTPTL